MQRDIGDPTVVAFSVALYCDGTLVIGGKEPHGGNAGLAEVLRMIADAVQAGVVNLREYPR